MLSTSKGQKIMLVWVTFELTTYRWMECYCCPLWTPYTNQYIKKLETPQRSIRRKKLMACIILITGINSWFSNCILCCTTERALLFVWCAKCSWNTFLNVLPKWHGTSRTGNYDISLWLIFFCQSSVELREWDKCPWYCFVK